MCPAPCSCATEMKRMPASGNRSSASMYAEPTIPNTSFTPCATSVSTKASDGVIFCLPVTARRLASVIVFMEISARMLSCGVVPGLRFARLGLHHGFGRNVFVTQSLGNRLAGDFARGDVEAVLEMRVVGQRLLPAFARQREHERQRRVVQG